ncbi:MAG: phosphopyruvate hydratase [Syntrophales bacterium]
MSVHQIEKIEAREILSAVGRPTVQVTVTTRSGNSATASVPSGTSKGKYEAKELFDGGARFRGLGVGKAVKNVNTTIAQALTGIEVIRQREIDETLIALDGTDDKRKLGGNAILAVSLAVARAGARCAGLQLYRYIGGLGANRLPMPLSTIISGGRHSASNLAFEDYMLVFRDFNVFSQAVEALMEVRYHLEKSLKKRFNYLSEKGGAFAPPIENDDEALELILESIEKAGYLNKISLGLDVVGSDLYNPENKCYTLHGKSIAAEELLAYFIKLTKTYPITLIEDPFHEDDFENFAKLTAALPRTLIVGDDLFTTNTKRIKKGIEMKAGNALLLKVNQIGTVTESVAAGLLALKHNYEVIVSVRSGDTIDDFITDLAVGIGAGQIKLGSPVRGERSAKFNRLLEIELETATVRLSG